jgi:hypothetical protein
LLRQAMLNLWWRDPQGKPDQINQQMSQQIQKIEAQLAATQPGAPRLRLAHEIMGTIFINSALDIAPYLMGGILAQQLLLRIAKRETGRFSRKMSSGCSPLDSWRSSSFR